MAALRLGTLFFFALFVRFIFFFLFLHHNPCQLMYDAGHYHKIAIHLIKGKGVANDDGSAQFYRLPGYPYFLAVCYKILGTNPDYALFVQILLAALIPIFVFYLAQVFFPSQSLVAWCAALITALHPGFLIFSGLIMSETLFVLFFLLFLILFLSNVLNEQPFSVSTLFCAGLFLGLASLVRPVGHFVGLIALLIIFGSPVSLREKIKSSIVGSVGWIVIVGPWLIRNYALTGYLFFHTLSGVHFLNHSAVRLVMENYHVTYQQARDCINHEFNQALTYEQQRCHRPLFEIEKSLLAEKIACRYMHLNLGITLKHFVGNMLKTMFSLYSSELLVIDSGGQLPAYGDARTIKDLLKKFLCPKVFNKKIIFVIYCELFLFILLLLGFIYFVIQTVLVRKEFYKIFIVLSLTMLFVALSLACGYARLRFPVETLLIVGASSFLIKKRKGKYA